MLAILLAAIALPLQQQPRHPPGPAAPDPHRLPPVRVRRDDVLRGVPQPGGARAWSTDRSGATRPVDLTTDHLDLEAGSILTVAPGGALPHDAHDAHDADPRRLLLPYHLHVVQENGSVEDAGQPDLQMQDDSLRFDAGTGRFRGSVQVRQYMDGPPRDLTEPVTLVLGGTVESIDPQQLLIRRTNTYMAVTLTDPGASDSVTVKVLPPGAPDSEVRALTIPLARLPLRLSVSPAGLLGFGLEQATVTVSCDGVLPEGSYTVLLSADHGRIGPAEVTLTRAAPVATATLRSTGLGSARIQASGTPFRAAQAPDVEYALPVLFFLAALLGGAVGALIEALRRRRGRLRARSLALGLASGVLAVVAYAAGVNLIGVDFGSHLHEALVFTIAALAALLGLPALERLRQPA